MLPAAFRGPACSRPERVGWKSFPSCPSGYGRELSSLLVARGVLRIDHISISYRMIQLVIVYSSIINYMTLYYAQSAEFGFLRGWEFSCPFNFIRGLPESLTQGLLIGKLLTGGLGVYVSTPQRPPERRGAPRYTYHIHVYPYIYIYIYIYMLYIYIYRERERVRQR